MLLWVSVHKIESTGVKGKILACHHPTAAVYTQQTNCFAREKNIRATSQKMGERRLMSRAITYRCAQREREIWDRESVNMLAVLYLFI